MFGRSRSARGRTLLALGVAFSAAILVASLAPHPSLAFGVLRAAASDTSPGTGGDNSVIVSKPIGTVQNDLMIAAVTERTNGAIQAPPGWAIIQKVDNATTTANSLAIYYKFANASEF